MGRAKGEIAERVRRGEPLDHIPVIDFHSHLSSASEYYYIPRSSTKNVVAYMDRFGVDHMVTFAMGITSDPGAGNNLQYQAMDEYPQRFSSLTMLHAGFPQDWPALLEAGHRRGSRGIKLISQYQGMHEPDMDWSGPFDFARDKGWVVLHHSWESNERLEHWASNYPELVFIIGHANTACKNALDKYDNVYQNTSAEFANAYYGSMTQMLNTLPAEKIIYGSDGLDLDFGTAIGPIALLAVAEDTKEQILGGNALRIIRQLAWPLDIVGKV